MSFRLRDEVVNDHAADDDDVDEQHDDKHACQSLVWFALWPLFFIGDHRRDVKSLALSGAEHLVLFLFHVVCVVGNGVMSDEGIDGSAEVFTAFGVARIHVERGSAW